MERAEQIPNQKDDVIGRISAAAGLVAVAGGAFAVWFFDPVKQSFLPACPLYSLTGYACPGCGLTRGFHALFHGDVSAALGFNLLIPVFIIFFGYIFGSMALYAARGSGLKTDGFVPKFMWVFMVLLLVFGVVRNIPAYPFNLLFP